MTFGFRRTEERHFFVLCYGIVCSVKGTSVKKKIPAISCDVDFVRGLCNLLKKYQIEPEQMQYIIEDELWKREQVPFPA